jgi:hypothetical protein
MGTDRSGHADGRAATPGDADKPGGADSPGTRDGEDRPSGGSDGVPPGRGASEGEGQAVRKLSKDVLFDLVRNSRRRAVVGILWASGEPVPLGDLAERIAADEYDTTVEGVSSAQRKRVYVGLYQSHVPKLESADVVTHDPSTGEVALGPTAPQLYPYLPSVETSSSRPWPRYYLGFSLAMAAVLGATLVTGVASGPIATLLSALVVVGLCVMASVHAMLDDS